MHLEEMERNKGDERSGGSRNKPPVMKKASLDRSLELEGDEGS